MLKYKIVKYFKGKKLGEIKQYETIENAQEMCNYMNDEIKKITNTVIFKVEKI